MERVGRRMVDAGQAELDALGTLRVRVALAAATCSDRHRLEAALVTLMRTTSDGDFEHPTQARKHR
jgi:hypothetical protein